MYLFQDWSRYYEAPPTFISSISALVLNAGFSTVFFFRLATALRAQGWKRSSRLIHRLNMILSACDLSPQATVEPGLFLPHPFCVTIGHGARAGKNFTIFQGAVLGARTIEDGAGSGRAEYPQLGDGVTVYPNALVYGGIRVGDNAVILANSVVNRDVPSSATYGGAPARMIQTSRQSSEADS
jgi:serine O-acetyltransferase